MTKKPLRIGAATIPLLQMAGQLAGHPLCGDLRLQAGLAGRLGCGMSAG